MNSDNFFVINSWQNCIQLWLDKLHIFWLRQWNSFWTHCALHRRKFTENLLLWLWPLQQFRVQIRIKLLDLTLCYFDHGICISTISKSQHDLLWCKNLMISKLLCYIDKFLLGLNWWNVQIIFDELCLIIPILRLMTNKQITIYLRYKALNVWSMKKFSGKLSSLSML